MTQICFLDVLIIGQLDSGKAKALNLKEVCYLINVHFGAYIKGNLYTVKFL